MKKAILTFAVMFLIAQTYAEKNLRLAAADDNNQTIANFGCLVYLDGVVYDLGDLKNDSDYSVEVARTSQVLSFQVCQAVRAPCDVDNQTYAVVRNSDNSTGCKQLTAASSKDVTQKILNGERTSGLSIHYQGGATVEGDNASLQYSFDLKLKCDENASNETQLIIETADYDEETGVYTVEASSKYACPSLDLTPIWRFIQTNSMIFCSVFIVIGLFMTFFGKKFITVTLFLAGFLLVFIIIMAVAFGFFVKRDTTDNVKWVLVGLATLLGLLVGVGVSRQGSQKFGIFVLGCLLGVTVGQILYVTIIVRSVKDSGEMYYIVTLVLSAAIIGFTSMILTNAIEIVATAFFGSFLVFRVVGLVAGGYPTESQLTAYIHENNFGGIPWQFYAYLFGTLVLGIIGTCFQYKHHKEDKLKKKHKKEQKEGKNVYQASWGNQKHGSNGQYNKYQY